MTDITDLNIILATWVVAITAIISIIFNYKLISMAIAKDKPLIRVYSDRIGPNFPPMLFVKNEDGGRSDNVTLDIGGQIFGPYILKANESKVIPVEVTGGLKIDRLTYRDIHGNETTEINPYSVPFIWNL